MVMFVIADVRKTIDDLKKVMKNFESRVEFTEDLQKMSDVSICFQSSFYFFFFRKIFSYWKNSYNHGTKYLKFQVPSRHLVLGCTIALILIF